jgi:hypothetical protein
MVPGKEEGVDSKAEAGRSLGRLVEMFCLFIVEMVRHSFGILI